MRVSAEGLLCDRVRAEATYDIEESFRAGIGTRASFPVWLLDAAS